MAGYDLVSDMAWQYTHCGWEIIKIESALLQLLFIKANKAFKQLL